MIRVSGVSKSYRRDAMEVPVLDGLDLVLKEGDFVALMGPSGSGKTTLLNLIAGLDRPTRGRITVGNVAISDLNEAELAPWRAHHVGFIFQLYNLIPVLTALENVELPLLLTDLPLRERREHARAALAIVGLADRMEHYPRQLSGGQEQRVAIARAIATDPALLVADEPTGDLDAASADEILTLLNRLNQEFKKTIVMVTHDPRAAARAHRTVLLEKGKLAAAPAPVPGAATLSAAVARDSSLEHQFLRHVVSAMAEYASARTGASARELDLPAGGFEGLGPDDILELIAKLDGLFDKDKPERAAPAPAPVREPLPMPSRVVRGSPSPRR